MLPLVILAAATALPVDYREPANWLCRPGRRDACAIDTTVTVLGGGPQPQPHHRAPAADCFYVYPTVSLDAGPNSDTTAGIEERGMAGAQLAPFAGVCRLYAPIYRQVTLTGLRAMLGGKAVVVDRELPYADVRAAWRDYLEHDNRARPFVLIGHSQGSLVLKRLIVEEIDGKPVAARMLSAILPGTTVAVPVGADVGGDFKALPLCRSDTQTGCVLTWASYRDTVPPPANALFGKATAPGMAAGCTNPAALGGGSAPLDARLGAPWWRGGVAQYRPPEGWALRTRFVASAGLLSAGCRSAGGITYLAVHVDPAAAGLAAALVGPAAIGDKDYPEWGWHVVDMAIVQGDLIRLVGRQTEAWRRSNR